MGSSINPASEYITILGCDACEVNIYKVDGKKVITENIPAHQAQLDVSQLSFGTYILELVVDWKAFFKKILIK